MPTGKMAPKACAACRLQRKRCSDECLLAPFFRSDYLERFGIVQNVYGRNRIVKMLKDVKAEQRGDVVNSLVYEATARLEDPVYGSTRATHQLQKRIADLESQLTATQAELLNVRFAYEKLVSLVTVGSHDAEEVSCSTPQQNEYTMYEKAHPMLLWETLWEA